jgi:hypothetical protein
MTGYVMISREEFVKKMASETDIFDIIVYIVNGGQQTRGIQKAIVADVVVARFRGKKQNFPVLTLYAGLEMKPVDFPTVISCSCISDSWCIVLMSLFDIDSWWNTCKW